MSSVVVDTDVISFLFKDHPIASRYDVDLASRTLVISFMTLWRSWIAGLFTPSGVKPAGADCERI